MPEQITPLEIKFILGAIKGLNGSMKKLNCRTIEELEKRVLKIKEQIEKK